MRYFTFLIVLGFTSQLLGQVTYNSSADSDKEAIKILEKISNEYTASENHRIDFTLDIELSGQAKETQKGYLIQKDDNFILDIEQRRIISNGETVWLYLKEQNEVQINDADFEEDSEFNSPSDIFQLYKSDKYVFAVANYAKEEGQDITQIEGKPLEDDSEYSKIRLTVIDKGQKVKRLKIFGKDGSRFTMNILSITANIELEGNAFQFNEKDYEGVFVEDLRF